MSIRVLALIPARGGSKGIPRKNARRLGGRPLVEWTIRAALSAHTLSRVVVSTDDEEIAMLATAAGAEAPFLRPRELALDETPTLPVLEHAVRWLEERGERIDAVCILQPTSPLRQPRDIDGCVDLLVSEHADTAFSVLPVPYAFNPHWIYEQAADGTLRLATGESEPISRRQQLPRCWRRDGAVFVVRRDVILQERTLYGARIVGYPMDPARHVDIDTLDDWSRAERLIIESERAHGMLTDE